MTTKLLTDQEIIDYVAHYGMINPFVMDKIRRDVQGLPIISQGLSSFGYDITLSDEFMKPLEHKYFVVDPLNIDPDNYRKFHTDTLIIPPNDFVLAQSVEYFDIPANVMGIVLGKSTYARCGILANFTPLEPGWRGYITIELSNTGKKPVMIRANQGIAQVLFFASENVPRNTYGDQGTYQDQEKILLPMGSNRLKNS